MSRHPWPQHPQPEPQVTPAPRRKLPPSPPRGPHYPAGFALACAFLMTALAIARCAVGCSAAPALLAELPAATEGIVALVEHELDAAKIPPGDPAYVAALAGARALEARQADAGAVLKAEVDAIILELHRSRPVCPERKPPPAPPIPPTVMVRAAPLPAAPVVLVDGGAGKDGGS